MNVVHEDVKQCVENELQHAVSVFGLHHSWHEKYAVILEELEELEQEVQLTKDYLNSVWFGVKKNIEDYAEANIPDVYEHAWKAACEAIQVAAMAKKEIAEQPQEARWQVSCDGYYPYCPICGAQPDKKTRFCAECGAKLGE